MELVERAHLSDGTELLVRPILPEDDERLERLFPRLSAESLYRRFFAPVPRLRHDVLEYLVNIDYDRRMALVVLVEDDIIAVARYDRLDEPGEAEAAIIVEDAWQHRGIGTRLLWRLAAAARERGVERFVAGVLAENRPMLGLLRAMSPDVETSLEGGEFAVRMGLGELEAGAPKASGGDGSASGG